jgi:pseudouridine-5'-phosphate glycosidase
LAYRDGMTQPSPLIDVAPEVAEALSAGRPVVALESTIITHGMPFPENAATALEVEAVVRGEGATPATIAIVGGRIKAGLSQAEIERLGRAEGVAKVSRRDVAALVAAGGDGGTTVAATMLIAHMVGVSVFATGGIGGVHRGAETTFDVSADLDELARTPVAVVCAGAKSILDLPKTLEALETRGVPVWGYGTDELPGFFTRGSGLRIDRRFDDVAAIARALHVQRALGLGQGVLICNPPPGELAMAREVVDHIVERALKEAEIQGVKGKGATPFLLERLNAMTGGESLRANIALIRSNAALAARIAIALAAGKPAA